MPNRPTEKHVCGGEAEQIHLGPRMRATRKGFGLMSHLLDELRRASVHFLQTQ